MYRRTDHMSLIRCSVRSASDSGPIALRDSEEGANDQRETIGLADIFQLCV